MLGGAEEDTVKVIIVGDGFVGKTSLLRRFVRGDFNDQYKKTIGAEFLEKDVFLRNSNTTVKLMLWDTAGQEVFNALTQAYYRGAGAAVVVFSTVDRESFLHAEGWKQRVEEACGPITMVLCQSKFDLSHEAAISNEEAETLAKQFKMPFYRVSSKDDFNITQLFEFTAQQCLNAENNATDGDSEAGADTDKQTSPTIPLHESEKPDSPAAPKSSAHSPTQGAAAEATGHDATASDVGNAARTDASSAVPQSPTGAPSAAPKPAAPSPSPAKAAPSAGKNTPTAQSHRKKHSKDPNKVTLTEASAVATPKQKKKKKCTLL